MHRICIVGCSGGGKTTFAMLLAQKLEIPHLELDSIYHQPQWKPLPREQFRAKVRKFTTGSEWVVDGNYTDWIGDITWGRADTIIWLDTPRLLATARVVRRTSGRLLGRKELWNGNRERWQQVLSRNPKTSIVVWAWKMHDKYTDRYDAAMKDPRWAHIRFVRIRTPREATTFLESLPPPQKTMPTKDKPNPSS